MNENNNITLIFDDIIYPLVDKLELKEGENKIQLIIKNPLTNLRLMFFQCKTLYNIDELKYLNTNHCFDFSSIFSGCDLLENVKPLEKWVFAKSCNLANMFKNTSLSDVKPLEKWYVLNCTNFSGMFYGCSSLSNLEGLEKWDVSNCTDFSKMFFNCSSLSDIKALEKWDVSKCTNFSFMFYGCKALYELSPLREWDVPNGANFDCIYYGCPR